MTKEPYGDTIRAKFKLTSFQMWVITSIAKDGKSLFCGLSAEEDDELCYLRDMQSLVELEYPDARDEDCSYVLTSRGEAYVAMLKKTPFPEQRWVNPETGDTVNV